MKRVNCCISVVILIVAVFVFCCHDVVGAHPTRIGALRTAAFRERGGERDSNLKTVAGNYSVLSLDPGYTLEEIDLTPEGIAWAKAHGFTELTVNPNNLSFYLINHADKYRPVVRELLGRGLQGLELEHALIQHVIEEFLEHFDRVSYEVDADIEAARFEEVWETRPEHEKRSMEARMLDVTVQEILRIAAISPKMRVKVPNTEVGHRAVEIIKREHPEVKINFTLFCHADDCIRGVQHLTEEDVISLFESRIDALTQKKENNIPLNYSQGLVSFIEAKKFYDWRKKHGVKTRIIFASLGVKTKIPGWMYMYMLTGGGQILTMPLKQAMMLEETTDLEMRANLDLPMEEFLLPVVMNPQCIQAARELGYWGEYTEGEMTEERARALIRKALREWEDFPGEQKEEMIWEPLAIDGFDKFFQPFIKARMLIKQLVDEESRNLIREFSATSPSAGVTGAHPTLIRLLSILQENI